MGNNRCKSCGGKKFRADRALAGKLICATCGSPIGTRTFNRSHRSGKYVRLDKSLIVYIIIALVLLLIILNR